MEGPWASCEKIFDAGKVGPITTQKEAFASEDKSPWKSAFHFPRSGHVLWSEGFQRRVSWLEGKLCIKGNTGQSIGFKKCFGESATHLSCGKELPPWITCNVRAPIATIMLVQLVSWQKDPAPSLWVTAIPYHLQLQFWQSHGALLNASESLSQITCSRPPQPCPRRGHALEKQEIMKQRAQNATFCSPPLCLNFGVAKMALTCDFTRLLLSYRFEVDGVRLCP